MNEAEKILAAVLVAYYAADDNTDAAKLKYIFQNLDIEKAYKTLSEFEKDIRGES